MSGDIHTCSYQCDRPACIREQRDELVAKLDAVTKDALALQGRAQRAESLLVHCRNDMLDVLASGRPTGSTDELADEIAALTDQGRAGEGRDADHDRIADPPYIGCAHLYKGHADYAGEVDHAALIDRLQSEYQGWVLHASATPHSMAILTPLVASTGARWCCWVKGFAAFKRNVPVAYAWEPVIIKPARKPVVSKRLTMRDWIQESITLKRGLTGAKPEAVCHWAFELVGARPEDDLIDLFPGTGAVERAWRTWQGKFTLPESA